MVAVSFGSGAAWAGGVGASITFSEESAARGVSFLEGPTDVRWGGGMAMVDLDRDGDLDLILGGGFGNGVALYENDGAGYFTIRSAGSGIFPVATSTVTVTDYDKDGYPDVFLGGWLSASKLYKNNGDFTFTDVTAAAGMSMVAPVMGSSWGDIDGDGWMDLYIPMRTGTNGNYTENKLMRNNGDGTFTDVAASLGVQATGDPTLLSAFFDFDRDGDDDLYLGTDKGSTEPMWYNKLYRNDGGGVWTEITDAANARGGIDCMGIAITDFDNDSFFDVYLTDGINNRFFIQEDGVFVDYAVDAGVVDGDFSWGAVFADFDNDTIADLFVTSTDAANSLYRGREMSDWPMVDIAADAGVALDSNCYTVATGDVNGDGLIDLLVGRAYGAYQLYINTTATANNWVRFRVDGGDSMATNGVGTCVSVYANGKLQTEQVRSGVNYKVSEEEAVHFGLGVSDEAVYADVTFLGGEQRRLTGVPAGYEWTVYPSSRLGDVDGDGVIEMSEVRAAIASITGAGVDIEPGDEIFDMDGDFDVDYDDIWLMGYRYADPNGPRGPRRR